MTSPEPTIVLRHYEIVRELGRGGMGVVYEGRDRRDDGRVAIKALHPYLAMSDPSFGERFEREAHIAALLRSPYTVHLLDFGVEGGRYLLVMEYIDGHTLADVIAQGPLSIDRALHIAADIARALEEASARGVVHRDIKPENILIADDGRVKVTDFGIARQAGGGSLTQIGAFVGTPAYAAPEQMDGDADTRSDVYALGATLYCMLAGSPPYAGTTSRELMAQHRTVALPMGPLAQFPDVVQNIVRRALEKDPLDRYQSPGELAGALERARAWIARTGGRDASAPTAPPAPATPPPVAAATPPARPATPPPVAAATPPARPAAPVDETAVVASSAPARTEVTAEPEAPSPTEVAASAGTPQRTEVAAAGTPPTVLARSTPPSATVVAPAPPEPAAAERSEPPAPTRPTARRNGRGRRIAVALGGSLITLGAIAAIVVVLTKGGDSTNGAAPSPTALGSATAAAASPSPAATPTLAGPLPTIFPPKSANFAVLSAGAHVRVVGSPPDGAGTCPLALWSQPSETASATNTLVQRVCNDQRLTVLNDPSTVAENATWWHVTTGAGGKTGWAKEVTLDGHHRFLALADISFTAPDQVIDPAKYNYSAIVMTEMGDMTIELYTDQSPRTVNSVVFMAEKGVYSGTTFYHVLQKLFIEGGDPTNTGTGDAGYSLPIEGNTVRNVRGAMAMYTVAGTTGSQFFIYTDKNPTQDFDSTSTDKVYPMGKVTEGLDVLDRIAAIPTNDTNFATTPVMITAVVIQQTPKSN